MEAILTPRFFATDCGLWAFPPTAVEPEELDYDYGYDFKNHHSPHAQQQPPAPSSDWKTDPAPWNTTAAAVPASPDRRVSLETPWTRATKISSQPPEAVSFLNDWQDDVSLLNDDPDDDDVALLPHSTCNVLAPLLDEMYKDESEADWDDNDDEDTSIPPAGEWNEEEVL